MGSTIFGSQIFLGAGLKTTELAFLFINVKVPHWEYIGMVREEKIVFSHVTVILVY